MARRFFRKDVLQHLSSLEELQERLVIVSFKSWVALGILASLLLAAILWSVVAKIPVQATGKAILFDPEKIYLVRSQMEGRAELKVKTGSEVSQGEPIAFLHNFELEALIHQQKLLIKELEDYLEQLEGSSSAERATVETQHHELVIEKAKLEGYESMLEKATVCAPFSGTVVSMNIKEGDVVSPGTVLFSLQHPRDPQEPQSIYGIIPFESGAQIQVGMQAMVDLASVDVAKYGHLMGVVKEVFPYLTSLEQSPLKMIPGTELQEYFGTHESFVIIKIVPLSDPNTYTKYLWTTKLGPSFPLLEGTRGTVKIILSEKRPISFLIPVFK